MKPHLFEVSTLVVIVSLCWLVSTANASSITREYDVDFFVDQKYLTFRVKMVIETEANGAWKTNTLYQIDYLITLTYLNESLINRQGFSLFFYEPLLLVDGYIFGTGDHETVVNSTSVWAGHDGILTLRYGVKGGERLRLNALLQYQVFKDNTVWIQGVDWHSTEPIWIDLEKESSTSPDYTTPILYTVLGIVIALVPTGTYLVYKSRKKNVKEPRDPPTT